MRSLAVLPTSVSENQSVYPHPTSGEYFYSYLDELLVDNGTPDQEQYTPGDTPNFAYFVANNMGGQTPRIYINDVRLWDGTEFGDNLLSERQEIVFGSNTVSVHLDTPVTIAALREGGIGLAIYREVYEYGGTEPSYSVQQAHILLEGMVQSDIPNDAEVSDIVFTIGFSIKNTFTPPNWYDIGALFYLYTEYEYETPEEGSGEFELIGENTNAGFLEVDGYEFKTDDVKKRYQYMIYNRGVFMGELTDIVSLPSLRLALNSFPSEVTVDVAKDASADKQDVDGLMVVDDGEPEPAIDNELVEVNVTGDVVSAYGDGTMINVNNDVDVYEYNGHYEGIDLDDGEPLITDELERVGTPIGSPEGKMFFSGYISKYDVSYKKDRKGLARLTLLSHADEYNNVVLSAEPSAFAENFDTADNEYLVMGAIPQSVDGLAYMYSYITFTPTSNTKLSTVQVYCNRNGGEYDTPSSFPQATVFISDNMTDPRGNGLNVIASSSARIQKNKPYWQSFGFDNGVELEANKTYYVWFRCDTWELAWTMKLYWATSSIGNGGNWRYLRNDFYGSGGGIHNNTGTRAMQVKLMDAGGETLVPMYSKDPSEMAKKVIDYGLSLGSRIGYNNSSITMSGTKVTAKFNMNTLKEALDAIISYEPTDWYWYLDQTDLNIYLNPKSESVTHWLTLHKDVQELTLEHSMEDLVNEVYFTGGKATYEVPTPNENKNYQGGANNNKVVCSPIFKPEPDVLYKVYGDVENKTTFVKVYKYYNNSTTPSVTSVTEAKNGELTFSYSSTNDSTLTGICIACRVDGNPNLAPSKVTFGLTSEQNVYRHLVNTESQNKYRRALVKKTDQRVTNNLSADIIAEGEIARNNEPIFAGTVKVLRDEHLDMINPGSLVGFRNFGNYIDNLRLLVMEVVIERDTLELSLGAFVPKTSKRLEDIRRNLTALENQMNPVSPTGGTNG